MKIAIIGNGISGSSAARWIRKIDSNHEIIMISSESSFFYSRTALMYIYMGHMKLKDTQPYEDWFWKKNRITLIQDHVKEIEFDKKKLVFEKNEPLVYDKLILALGSSSNKFGWPGQDLEGVRGLYSLQDLEYMETFSKDLNRAVIVGGGLIGIEMAEMFASRKIPVTMLVREQNYWENVLPKEEAMLISKHIKEHHIDLRLGVNLQEIQGDTSGKANAVIVKETGEKISCGYVGLTAGVHPNVGWLKNSQLNINRGIVVNNQLETNISHVYAIGDCAEIENPQEGRRGIEAIWYTGRMMGETVAYNVCGKSTTYDPGLWFNSAKFLDIEYQVYGHVLAKPPEHHKSIYWEHLDQKKSIRIVYDSKDESVIGFNLMGIRFRHEVCEKWILSKTNIDQVVSNLSMANFDPEFYKKHERSFINNYNKTMNKNLKVSSNYSLNRVLNFLNPNK